MAEDLPASTQPNPNWTPNCSLLIMEKHVYPIEKPNQKGLGPDSAGQSGDTQGLSDIAESSSESVVELIEEGQFIEAGILEGIEGSSIGDPVPLRPKQFPIDDFPLEYQDKEKL